MIADCAIDPEVFAQWKHFQHLYDDFGVSRGRLISKFPKKSWLRSVAERAEEVNSPINFKRIEERLRSERFKQMLKPPSGREYDPEISWTENAIKAEPRFDLIVCSESATVENAIGVDDLMRDEPPFKRDRAADISRCKEHLIGVITPLLEYSDSIRIVDPNFRVVASGYYEARFRSTLLYMFEQFEKLGRWPKQLQVHAKRTMSRDEAYCRDEQRQQWLDHVVPGLNHSCDLYVCYWNKLPDDGRPHQRLVMSEKGGVSYDNGIDEGPGETVVTLLEDAIWQKRFDLFDRDNLPEDFAPDKHVLQFPER